MIDSGHFGAIDIKKKIAQLEARWEGINEHAQTRHQRLADAHQAQQYFSEAQEAESWMKEKEPMVAGRDYGKDEDSAQVQHINFHVQKLGIQYRHELGTINYA